MRIGIDARFLTHPQPGGFKTYSEHLVHALAAIDQQHTYVLYVDRAPAPGDVMPQSEQFRVHVVSGGLPLVGMPWREQLGLASRAVRDKLDLFHAPCLTAPLALPCPLVVTIHDMIWKHPQRYAQGPRRAGKRSLMDRYYQIVPQLAAQRATEVITVSYAAKAAIVAELKLPATRVSVTHEAAKPGMAAPHDPQRAAQARARFGLKPNYVLAIGSADPRKNLVTLLQAYARLPESLQAEHQLAIVWTHRHLAEALGQLATSLGIAGRVTFLTEVSDAELAALYAGAALFVFPSRYEGFGLPLLEAMACGAPVVAANNSSIPEIVGNAALLVPAEDGQAMAEAISRVLSQPTLQAALRTQGLARAAGFSWQRCAHETLAVYLRAAHCADQSAAQREPGP